MKGVYLDINYDAGNRRYHQCQNRGLIVGNPYKACTVCLSGGEVFYSMTFTRDYKTVKLLETKVC